MNRICPNCEAIRPVENVDRTEIHIIRGEEICVAASLLRCEDCGVEFENTRGPDALDHAYRKYRQRHGMMQPESIRELRARHGLTQRELAGLLNWGGATLSRYENGALQEGAHDKLLKLASDSHNLIQLIRDSEAVMSDEKKGRLIDELKSMNMQAYSVERVFEQRFGGYSPDEFSGFGKLEWKKLHNAVLLLCADGQLKTKLTKLLFYLDFKHFKEYAVSICGARYAHLPFGPVPDNYDYFFAPMIHEGALAVDEISVYQYIGENYSAKATPDISVFSAEELHTLQYVKNYFRDFSATRIREFSHQERGYRETGEQALISYRYASDLQI